MQKTLSKFPEWRVVGFLAVIALGWHVFTLISSFLGYISDIILIILLSWIFAFIVEPLVELIAKKGFSRLFAALITYIGIAIVLTSLILIIFPTVAGQFQTLSQTLPQFLPQSSPLTPKIEGFITSSLANSVSLVSQTASAAATFFLIYIVSFYFLISRKEITQTILKLIPDRFEDDYLFLEKTLSQSFATFLRVQFIIGITIGLVTFFTLAILRVDFAISTSIASAIFAMIPVIGPFIAIVPPALAALTVSVNQAIIATGIILLASQVVYNILAPKLLGNAFKIHPVIILFSFLIGFKVAGVWGSIFSIPILGAFSILAKDLIKYWNEEADK